jgi:hypothetical protein
MHRSKLLWTQVILERRYWNSISLAVMSAFAWTIAVLGGVDSTSPLWWGLALLTGVSAACWLYTFRGLGRIQRRLDGGGADWSLSA